MALFDDGLLARLFHPIISKELGNMNCPVTPQIDIVACLLDQNHYQRLGLKTNAVARSQLKQAYRSRLELLKKCRHEIDDLQYHQARRLLNQAIEVLCNKQSRQEYDSQLFTARNGDSPADEQQFSSFNDRSSSNHSAHGNGSGNDDKSQVRPLVQATLVTESTLGGRSQRKAEPHASPSCNIGETQNREKSTNSQNSGFGARYELGEPLSRSERCSIFQAVDRRLNREVVVKRIDRSLLCNEEHARLFREEAELFARSNASNLVKILDYDAKSGAIVLEKMKQDLSQMAQQRPRDPDSVREILRDALSGLAWLHDQGMAHGRVELTHVLVDDNGGVKLAVSPGMTGVSTSFRPGLHTRHVAPELLNRQYFGPPGLAADIYAMGFVALELLCGKTFAGRVNPAIEAETDSSKGWLLWHASPSEHLPNLKALVDGLPDDLVAVLTRMTTKQQNERWTDARQCLTALQHVPSRSSAAIEIQAEHVDPAQFGVEILGTPPSLHAEYEARESISWRDILRDPKLLTHPLARSKMMSLALGCVCCLATTLLLFNPRTAAENATEGLQESREIPRLLADIELAANQELALAVPVDVEPPVIQDVPIAPVSLPIPVASSILIEEISIEETPLVVADETQYAVEPAERSDEIEEVRYWPTFPAFEWQHHANSDSGLTQYKRIEKELWEISTAARSRLSREYPFKLGNQLHDPRAPFSLALTASAKGDNLVSRQMCDLSLHDAKQLRVPFMLPLILITHLLCENGEHAAALSYCRDTLRWHSLTAERTGDQRFVETTSAIAWWTGLVVGFVEDVKGSSIATTADTRGAEQFVKQTVSAEQFATYLLAKRYVNQRYRDLSETRFRPVVREVRKRQPTKQSNDASNTALFNHDPYAENTSSSHGRELVPYDAKPSADSTVVETRRQVDRRVASPASLRSYYPFDVRSLADHSRYSLRMPSSKSTIPKSIDRTITDSGRFATKNKVARQGL